MRRATENLLHDHDHILIAVDAIDRALWFAARGQRSIQFFELALEFVVVYADGAHYDKEELLFEAVQAPMPPAAGPIACLRMEHETTSAQSELMDAAIKAIHAGNAAEWFTLIDAALRYTTIIRVHLPKETGGFFPMADQVLAPTVQAELLTRFEAIDSALPMTMEAIAAALQRLAPNAPNVVPARVETTHVDKYQLYDDNLASALAQLVRGGN